MNPDRAALMAGPQAPAMAKKTPRPKPGSTWNPDQKPREKNIKPKSKSQKKLDGKKPKKKWTPFKPTSKRSQRAGPRSLAKQGLRVRLPKTPEQKAKQLERKEFRLKQKAGVAARKIIKTARREGYRVVKRIARPMREYQARYRLALIAVEQEAVKKIHVELDEWERRNAMAFCNSLGFTIENTEGTNDIKPRLLGMKGKEVDIDNLETVLRAAEEKVRAQLADKAKYGDLRGNRVDLGKVADESKTTFIGGGTGDNADMDGDFISFDMDDDDAPVAEDDVNYNHKMRRKLNRALLVALIKKENLVRARAWEHCKENGIEIPQGFTAAHQPAKLENHRMLIDGSIETAKQERIRKRVETAKYNELARAFRKTAKIAQKAAEQKAQQEVLEQYKADRLAQGLSIDDIEKNPPWAEHHSEKSKRVKREKRQRAQAGKKRSSDSSGSSSDGDSSDSDASVAVKSENSSKKRARSESDDDDSGEAKKIKLENAAQPVSTESSGSSDPSAEFSKPTESKKEKKKSKKTVRIADPPEVIMEDAPAIAEEKPEEEEKAEKTEKPAKKERKAKKELIKEKREKKAQKEAQKAAGKEKSEEKPESEQQETPIGNDWNADALDGDTARKDKFLRLLGGKKESTSSKPASKASKGATTDISKVQSDLEKQFQQGIELKHGGGGQGKRRGIGA